MKQEIPKPVVAIAVIVVAALAIFLGKSLMAGPPQPSKEERAKFTPSWIDPVTNKPKAAGGAPQTGGPGSPQMGSPTSGSPSSGSPSSGGSPMSGSPSSGGR